MVSPEKLLVGPLSLTKVNNLECFLLSSLKHWHLYRALEPKNGHRFQIIISQSFVLIDLKLGKVILYCTICTLLDEART